MQEAIRANRGWQRDVPRNLYGLAWGSGRYSVEGVPLRFSRRVGHSNHLYYAVYKSAVHLVKEFYTDRY